MNSIRLLCAIFTAIYIYSNSAIAAIFTPLGYPWEESWATAVSADGSVVVGYSRMFDPYFDGFRWTSEGGRTSIISEGDNTFAYDVSDDGSVVVGEGVIGYGYSSEAFRWTIDGGIESLGTLWPNDEYAVSSASAVSANGSVIVGRSELMDEDFGANAFRWTSEGGMESLGTLWPDSPDESDSDAHAVSADGSVIVGSSRNGFEHTEAFRWTSEGGMVGLGHLGAIFLGERHSYANDVSADGKVVVGESTSRSALDDEDIYTFGTEAFRWTSESGMVGLGYLQTDVFGDYIHSNANGVSADGTVVVGYSMSASAHEAFRWTSEDGMQSVASILTAAGVDLTGWTLNSASGVSADGSTIVGYGKNPDGLTEAWVADLSVMPTPTTPVDLSGTIKTTEDMDICAVVLASGQYKFSCNPVGVFSLTNLPREQNGTVKRQIYADGFFPKINILVDSTDEAVIMTRSGDCPSYNTLYVPAFIPDSAGKRINISGKVLLKDSQTPICAMVLANGQHMFSCDGTGNYALNIPLDTNGQFKLQVYAEGFAPTIQKFDEYKTTNIVRMARAIECQ